MDAVTGKVLKSLPEALEGETFALSADGTRLAVLVDFTVEVRDVDRQAEMWRSPLPHQELPPRAGPGKGAQSRRSEQINLEFSADSRRLVATWQASALNSPSGGTTGQLVPTSTVVWKTETGESLPALEGSDAEKFLDAKPSRDALMRDGRLLALFGKRLTIRLDKTKLLWVQSSPFLTVWDTQTGKALKTWDHLVPVIALNPVRPLLAIAERNGGGTRLGFWDFSAEMSDKK